MLTVISTKATGRTVKLMVMESFVTLREAITKVFGKMINSTELVKKPGIITKTRIMANLSQDRKMAKVKPYWKIVLMRVISKMGCFTVMESIPLIMAKTTKANSPEII